MHVCKYLGFDVFVHLLQLGDPILSWLILWVVLALLGLIVIVAFVYCHMQLHQLLCNILNSHFLVLA
jgi:hypothetical protein